MWLRNLNLPGTVLPPALARDDPQGLVLCDVEISSRQIETVRLAGGGGPGEDLEGGVAFPGFCDAHVHLDKAHTWDRAPNPRHTFAHALEILHADKANWNEDEMYRRAEFTLRSAWAHGVSAIRTHVDTWGTASESSYRALARLRAEWTDRISLQLVSLCGVEDYAGPEGAFLADLPVAFGASALGGMPLMGPRLADELDALFSLAAERAMPLDLHVDESGDPGAACLRAVAEAVERHRFPHPVTCGHCCSLAVQDERTAFETLDRVAEAGIRIITLPLCNLYLQDRRLPGAARQTPHWRGLTLIREMLARGIPVASASDNVRDAFYAYGDLDPWEVLVQTIRLGHLDTQAGDAAALVTRGAAELMGLGSHGRIAPGAHPALVVFPGRTWSELLSRPSQARRLWHGEGWRPAALPDFRELDF